MRLSRYSEFSRSQKGKIANVRSSLYVLSLLPEGLLETEPLQGRDEDAIASADFSNMLSEEEKEELKAELVQVCSVIFYFCLLLNTGPMLQLCCLSCNEVL